MVHPTVLTVSRVLALSMTLNAVSAHPYKRFSNTTTTVQLPQQLDLTISELAETSITPTTSLSEQSLSSTPTQPTLSPLNLTSAVDESGTVLVTSPSQSLQITASTSELPAASTTRSVQTAVPRLAAPSPDINSSPTTLSPQQSTQVYLAFEATCTGPITSGGHEPQCLEASSINADYRVTQSSMSLSTFTITSSVLTPISTVHTTRWVTDYITVCTDLETTGHATSGPLISFSTGEISPTATVDTSLLTLSAVTLSSSVGTPASTPIVTPAVSSGFSSTTASPAAVSTAFITVPGNTPVSIDPFQAIATDAVPGQLKSRGDFPVPTANILAPADATLQTNKFYANLFLGTQGSGVFALPYTLNWVNGSGGTKSYGMAIQNADSTQRVTGSVETEIPGEPIAYYTNPLNLQQVVLSAAELSGGAKLTVDSLETFSVNANLAPLSSASTGKITFPIVQGMGFTTALYTTLQPEIQSAGAFTNVAYVGTVGIAQKFRLSLNDGTTWLLYAIPQDSTTTTTFTLTTDSLLQGPANWIGTIQVAKVPAGASETLYDISAGVYATSATLTGAVSGKNGQYSLTWSTVGSNSNNGNVLAFALPHMVDSFSSTTRNALQTSLRLQTPTKGVATAVTSNVWTMVEADLPDDMTFTPWSPETGAKTTYSASAVNAIYAAAQLELSEDISAQTNLNSMYYAGKAFSKFASILIAVNDICGEEALAQSGLARLEAALALVINNQQANPLAYDTVFKGVVSTASYEGDVGADFGNTYYNDHHFHYGYFLHTAAVIAHLNPSWLTTGTNRAWVDALARDVSNPSSEDTFFPIFRYFDWFQGHSWAHGLYESADGKDEESSSEDVMFSYGLKLWGMVTGDQSMEARGNLMLAVQARSLQSYFLLEDNNQNQPADFIDNKVTGILFENKVDHTTFFGTNLEYIQGIQMIPLIPASALTRTSTFVQQEWEAYFADNATDPASEVVGGWKGILYANLALWEPQASYEFFSSPSFDVSWLDGGASLTWYLAFSAGLGGSPA